MCRRLGIKIEQTAYRVVPMGEYKARIIEINQVEGKFAPQLEFKCRIVDGEHDGTEFRCWMNTVFSPKSKLYQWVESSLGLPIPKDYTFDSDYLIGREVIVALVVRELDGGGEVNRVDRVRAVRAIQQRLDA